MTIKLYSGPLSMFGRKAEIACAEKGIDVEVEMVPFSLATFYEPKHPEVARINPKGQVPVLVDGGLELYDSTQIFEYLEDRFPEPALWPREPDERARARQAELGSDEVFFPNVIQLMPHLSQGAEAAAKAAESIKSYYAAQEALLAHRGYLWRDFSYADIAFYMASLFAAFLGRPWGEGHPNLDAWKARMLERPPVAKAAGGVADYLASQGISFTP
jgi:glutathione S-transferase